MPQCYTIVNQSFVFKQELGCFIAGYNIFRPSSGWIGDGEDSIHSQLQHFFETKVDAGLKLNPLFSDEEQSDAFREELSVSEFRKHILVNPELYITSICNNHTTRNWIETTLGAGVPISLVVGLITLKPIVQELEGDSPTTETFTTHRVSGLDDEGIWRHEGERVVGIKFLPVLMIPNRK